MLKYGNRKRMTIELAPKTECTREYIVCELCDLCIYHRLLISVIIFLF